MWWYNIVVDKKGIISHLFQLDPINEGSVLLTDNLAALNRGNSDPILILKRTEWSEFVDYSCKIIKANPSRVGKIMYIVPILGIYQYLHM